MTPSIRLALSLLVCATAGCGRGKPAIQVGRYVQPPAGRSELARFGSAGELRSYLAEFERMRARDLEKQEEESDDEGGAATAATPSAEPAAPPPADGAESITNTQEAGVDEGGIVKAYGEYLVVLRRGRLFSVRLGDKQLQPISKVNVFPPGSNRQAWYDEMLIADGRIVVVGYSYDAQATELGLFDIDAAGTIAYRGTHLLRSNDYYSSRNYASRLIGDKLVFYMPYSLISYQYDADEPTLAPSMPAVRAYDERSGDWDDVISATDIYRPIQAAEWPILHTVVSCDLSRRDLDCTAQGIIGPYGRSFYVSPSAVYVWVTAGHTPELDRTSIDQTPGVVYRLPLDGSEVGAVRVAGAPIDQFSFKEDADGFLDVLVRAEGGGDWMWSPEVTGGDVAMLRLPVAAFGSRVGTARREAYTALPRPTAGHEFQNRYVGEHILYGTGSGWGYAAAERDDRVFLHSLRTGQTTALELTHGVDRIEAMGRNAVVIGTDGQSLVFSAIGLGARPHVADRLAQRGATQGELRSHGFFFKPSGDDGDGLLGLPTRTAGQPGAAHLVEGSAEVLFLEVDDLAFRRLGPLTAHAAAAVDDGCQVSCVDWYGNARPIFYRGRVFALLGYELVEGAIADDSIREIRRIDFLGNRTAIAR